MKKTLKLALLGAGVFILAAGLVAFRPFGGDADESGIDDHTEALAEVLDIDVETLQSAMQTAREKALTQAVADGLITEDQAEAMQSQDFGRRVKHFRIGGDAYESYLADELGISVDALQTAQREAAALLLDQALEDGRITQEEYDQMQLHNVMRPYFDEAFSSAFQNAIDAALADGTITEEQAELLQDNPHPGRRGVGMGHPHGGKHFFARPDIEGE
ncbi:MAG: hypothetical protein PVI99_06750 [Anaerolineales bacterium]|jgi:hypothetical protein